MSRLSLHGGNNKYDSLFNSRNFLNMTKIYYTFGVVLG